MSEPFTLYKLIILYMLDKVDFPLTNAQISGFILDKGYTTYFKLQQALSELTESGFIREEATHSRTFYHLTEEGEETIHFFRNKISDAIIFVDAPFSIRAKRAELRNGTKIEDFRKREENQEDIVSIFETFSGKIVKVINDGDKITLYRQVKDYCDTILARG